MSVQPNLVKIKLFKVKSGTDGSMLNASKASCGGLLQNSVGEYLGGYSVNLGVCSITIAEVWRAFYGLQLAWDKGYQMVILEMDSSGAISLITSVKHIYHPYGLVIQRVPNLLKRSWVVEVKHAFREANRSADALASLGHLNSLGVIFYEIPPVSLSSLLCEDFASVVIPYFVV